MGVWIEFKDGVAATAYYHPGAPTKLLLGGGPKGHLEWLRDQYEVELDGQALLEVDPGTHGLMVHVCMGTVKNTGKTPLTATVQCAVPGFHQEGGTTPATIAPGATGKYHFLAGPAMHGGEVIEQKVLRDGKDIPYFDAHGASRP